MLHMWPFLSVQSTQFKGILGFHIRIRSYGSGYIPYGWLRGPLGPHYLLFRGLDPLVIRGRDHST